MDTLENVCILAKGCKAAGTSNCNVVCYPYVIAHGSSGKGGFWNSTNVPKKYKNRTAANLDLIKSQNPEAYEVVKMYVDNVDSYVNEGVGLFLYSIPTADNRMGTGTGKTTAATTIINEYVIERIKQQAKGQKRIEVTPAYFVRASEFQNIYNAQFRGTDSQRMEASESYYNLKRLMIETELLVIDDISLRQATEALANEIYEILDERSIEGLATILTSNQPLERLGEMLTPQIESRIAGMTELVGFTGKDNRKAF